MNAYSNRYSGEEDFRFPALKHRLEPFRKFKYSPRGRKLELEGIFIYKYASPSRNPDSYLGYLDLKEEYRLLGLKPPEKKQLKIWCRIPSELTSREKLISKPNIRVTGRVSMDMDKESTKHFLVDEIEFLPIQYRAVGAPAFDNFEDMFSCIYSREPKIYEHGPILLLASLIGSERRSIYFPDENVGCGINMGTSAEDLPGKVGAGAITTSMKKQLRDFIRKVNIGSLDTLSTQFRWNRFLSVDNPEILSRRIQTNNEIDWNLISNLEEINQLKRSKFIASDINLVYDPDLFPPKINREDAKNVKQTLLFAKSTPQITYSESINALIEVKIEDVIHDLAKRVDYAPFLFRYRLEPLCDAFLKGNHLADYLLGADISIKRRDVREFFKRAKDVALDFATYAERYIDPDNFGDILEGARDRRAQDILSKLFVKGSMTEDQMIDYLMDKYGVSKERAESIIASLVYEEPVLVIKRGNLYMPV